MRKHTRKHLRLWVGIALVLVVPLALNPVGVDALAKVGKLMIEGDDVVLDGEVFIVPPGSEEVAVTFDYTGASRSIIAVRIEGVGGLRLYESEARYSGDGAASITVRGAEFFLYLAEAIETTSRELVSVVRDLSSATSITSGEVIENLTAVENILGTVSAQLDMLEGAQLEGAAAGAADEMRSSIDDIDLYLDEAKSLAVDDIDGKKAQAKLMSGPADELRSGASTVASSVEGMESAAFPESGGDWRYTVSARLTEGTNVKDAIADSVEFEVVVPGELGGSSRAGDPTAGPTARSGGDTGGITGGMGRRTTTPPSAEAAATQTSEAAFKSDAATQGAQGPGSSGRGTPVTSSGDGEGESDDGIIGAGESEDIGEFEPGFEGAAEGGPEGAGEQGEGDGSVDALPTWTVPANRASSGSDSGSGGTQAEEDSNVEADPEGGLNLGILFLGILALIAIAFWMRRRM